MKRFSARFRGLASDDSGMTLMEVIVAIAIMTTIALAAASVSLNGTKSQSAVERQQVAVTIANGAMEKVSGWTLDLDSSTGVSMLYYGRAQSAVNNAFNANLTLPGVAQTNQVWDIHAPADVAPGGPSLPITTTSTQNGTIYTTTTLIGSCYQSTLIQTAQTTATPPVPVLNNCVAASGPNTDMLIRVIVIVSWTAGAQCQASGCYYETSTLLDPNADLEWVTH